MHKYINYSNIFSDILPSLRTLHIDDDDDVHFRIETDALHIKQFCMLSENSQRSEKSIIFLKVSSRVVMKCASKRRSEFSICERISAGPSVTTSLHSLCSRFFSFCGEFHYMTGNFSATSGHLHMAKMLSFSDK